MPKLVINDVLCCRDIGSYVLLGVTQTLIGTHCTLFKILNQMRTPAKGCTLLTSECPS